MSTKRIKTYTTYRLNGDVKALPNHKRRDGRFMEKESIRKAKYCAYAATEATNGN